MRWTLNCILLASIAVISASKDDDRTKRDLSFFKNLLSSKFETAESSQESAKEFVKPQENFKLFRIPGFEKVLVKATPKRVIAVDTPAADNVEVSDDVAFVTHNPKIAIINSYLGTSQLNETLLALQRVKNLLSSGVLEARRPVAQDKSAVSYPTYVFEAGKIVANKEPFIVGSPYPVPVMERYRPLEYARLPDLPIPTKYSHKQVHADGLTTYSAKDNNNVLVSEMNRPVPLPPYVTYRIQEAKALGAREPTAVPVVAAIKPAPLPIPVYNVPKVQPAVIPFVTPNRYIRNFPVPQVLAPPPMAVNIPTSYSYQNIHNGGDVTTYTGSREVLHRHGDRPVVVTEVTKSMPLPPFFATRIEDVAAKAIAVKLPNRHPHKFYETPIAFNEPPQVMIEERPAYVYDHVNEIPPIAVHYNRPIYREDVDVHFAKHKNIHHAAGESGQYSYKNVHGDGSVTTYTDTGVYEESHKESDKPEVVSYHDKYSGGHHNNHNHDLVREDIFLDPPSPHFPKINQHVVVHATPNGYCYNSIHGDGSMTAYSGSGYVEHKNVHPIPMPITNPKPPVKFPELVTPEEFLKQDSDSPQRVMFKQPIVSKYVYKQVNHNSPDVLTFSDADLTLDGQVNVKVGEVPVPKPFLTPPSAPTLPATPTIVPVPPFSPKLPVLPTVTPEALVYVPPSNTKEPILNGKPTIDSHDSETDFSYTHMINEGDHTNKGGSAAFESTTLPPIVKIGKTKTSVSFTKSKSSSRSKFVKTRTRVKSTTSTTTEASSNSESLSANPIVVLPEEETFPFKQDRSDGPSITVVGNNDKVSVNEDSKPDDQHRGDIPSSSY